MQNEELEKEILSLLFNREDVMLKYEISERDISNPSYKKILKAIKLYGNDMAILQGKLNPEEYLILQDIAIMLVPWSNAEALVNELKRLSEMRRLMEINKQVQIALETDSSMENILEKISQYEKVECKETNIQQSIQRIIQTIDGDYIPVLYPTKYTDLDYYLGGGFTPGQLNILAARPSKGKTMLAMCLMLNMVSDGHKVAFFSLEMTVQQMVERMVANNSGVAVASLKRKGDEKKAEQISKSMDRLLSEQDKIFLYDNYQTTQEIIRQIKYLAKYKQVKIFYIDYLGLLVKGDNRYIELSKITRQLKMVALQLDIVIVCLSQLNRGLEGRADSEPRLSDLRDSGSIEQDADIVLMLDRDIDEGSTELKIFIRKNRNGSCGEIQLECLPASMQIGNKKREKPF